VLLDRLVRYLLPRETRFFTYLEAIARNMAQGADVLATLRDASSPGDHTRVAERLRAIEHEGDGLAHILFEALDRTFVTPLDREDLHLLCSKLDTVLDVAEASSARISLLGLVKVSEPMREQIRIYRECAHSVERCIFLLRDLSRPDEVNAEVDRMNTLENEADRVYRAELQRLFATPVATADIATTVEVLRQKEILDVLERAVDACEDVMDVVRSILVKHG
jgi:uncharacterized protein Yka (UPF0111/DUF47 family)